MSRLGKLPIKIAEGTQVKIEDNFIIVKGPKGELKQELSDLVNIEILDSEIKISVGDENNKKQKSFWGLYWSLINNMVIGVTDGFEKKLEANGVGYRVAIAGKKLTLNVGYSHPVDFTLPEGVDGAVEGNVITISGASKQLVGEMAAQIRKIRKPEPYKGKGIKYVDEIIRRKEGKAATKAE
jgi:large subunit ribosomal protein L6